MKCDLKEKEKYARTARIIVWCCIWFALAAYSLYTDFKYDAEIRPIKYIAMLLLVVILPYAWKICLGGEKKLTASLVLQQGISLLAVYIFAGIFFLSDGIDSISQLKVLFQTKDLLLLAGVFLIIIGKNYFFNKKS